MEHDYDTAGSFKWGALVHYVPRPTRGQRLPSRALCGTRWSRFWRYETAGATCQACVEEAAKRLADKRPPHKRPPRWTRPLDVGPRQRKSALAE